MTASSAAVAVITPEHRAQAFIRKGQRAWTAIKATAEEQRTLWLEVGVALMYGKVKENRRANGMDSRGRHTFESFKEWAEAQFPGIHPNEPAHAIWFAENFTTVVKIPDGLSHPERIRRWWEDQQAPWEGPSDLADLPPATQAPALPKREAEKVAKLIHRANSGDEGADIAKRHVKAVAERHEISLDDLEEAGSANFAEKMSAGSSKVPGAAFPPVPPPTSTAEPGHTLGPTAGATAQGVQGAAATKPPTAALRVSRLAGLGGSRIVLQPCQQVVTF